MAGNDVNFGTCPHCPSPVTVKKLENGYTAVICDRCDSVTVFKTNIGAARIRWNTRMDNVHGTIYGYRLGCKCELCRKASADYSNERRKKARESTKQAKLYALRQLQDNPNDKRHGTTTGYSYGCRCDECKSAQRNKDKNWYVRKRKAD